MVSVTGVMVVLVFLQVIVLVNLLGSVSLPIGMLGNDDDDEVYNSMEATETNSLAASRRTATISSTKNHNVDSIVVLGERHSGTTFATALLQSCFPSLQVGDVLAEPKHWFQPTPEWVVEAVQRYGKTGTRPAGTLDAPHLWWDIAMHPRSPRVYFEDTLVVVMVRDPYDWIEAMRKQPHHWPLHMNLLQYGLGSNRNGDMSKNADNPWTGAAGGEPSNKGALSSRILTLQQQQLQVETISPGGRRGRQRQSLYRARPLPWKDFVTTPLRLPLEDEQAVVTNSLCQKGYRQHTISPCDRKFSYIPPQLRGRKLRASSSLPLSANDPVYDLQRDGSPFAHPLELRAAKLKNLLELSNHWRLGGFIMVRLEDVNDRGSQILLNAVSSVVGKRQTCRQADPPRRHKPRVLEPEWAEWITEHTDWEVESQLGYYPRDITT